MSQHPARPGFAAPVVDKHPDWMDRAACKGISTELFIPSGPMNPHWSNLPKGYCAVCPVRAECLKWALEYDEHGVWGGTTERERRKLKKPAA